MSTKLLRGRDPDELTEQEREFIAALMADPAHNPTNAARKAGYAVPSQAGTQLMRRKRVLAALFRKKHQRQHRLKIKSDRVLKELYWMAMRDPIDLCDPDTGAIRTDDLRQIPERTRRCIEGIKQKTRTYRTEDGETVTEVEVELKFSSKTTSIDMLMKHLSLYAAERHQHEGTLNWDAMIGASPPAPEEDPVERRILEVEAANPTPRKPTRKPVRKAVTYTPAELMGDEIPE
jgi:phage terminase small subunit